jgi:hypothetical protein
MPAIDCRDAVGGALLVALGAAFAVFSWAYYPLGTFTRMGAGMLPFSLGIILALFGAVILFASFARDGSFPNVRLATPAIVLGSVVLFAVVIKPFGLMPAAFLATLVAAFADLSFSPIRNLALAAALSVLAYLIFSIGLQLPLPLFKWPL